MGLTHEFYLAPYSDFSHDDFVFKNADRLERVQLSDEEFHQLYDPILSRIPTVDGWHESGLSIIEPSGAAVAIDLFKAANRGHITARLRAVYREFESFAHRAASGKYFIYHSGL